MGSFEKQPSKRVKFERGIPASLVAIDGTWRRECTVIEIADDDAELATPDLQGLQLKEFFLLLTSVGVAYRRCELDWVNGERIGVKFLSHGRGKETIRAARRDQFI